MIQPMPGEKKTRTFRLSWLRAYAVLTFWVCLILSVPFGFSLVSGEITPARLAAILLPALVYLLISAFLYSVCFPTRLNESEVRGFNFWGLPGRMAWEEIASATPSRLLGLPWMIVRSHRTRNALWLPLFYADVPGFWRAVDDFASGDSPLRSFGTSPKAAETPGQSR
jgi:hypothetical protein